MMFNDDTEMSKDDHIIDEMVAILAQKDTEEKKRDSERAKKYKEDNDFCKLAKCQFEIMILSPLKEFVDKYNSKCPNGNIQITEIETYDNKKIRTKINLMTKVDIFIEIEILLEEDFHREEELSKFGRKSTRDIIDVPKLREKKIYAWGRLYDKDERGFNIFLAEKKEDKYGEWFLMENRYCIRMQGKVRKEPFGFKLIELEDELKRVDIDMHRYSSTISPLDMNLFFNFIKDAIKR